MRINAPLRNLPTPYRPSGALFEKVPAFLTEHGFQGLEITDREFTADVLKCLEQSAGAYRRLALDLIIDINTDLTLSDDRARQSEIAHALRQLRIAERLHARCCRTAWAVRP